MVVHKDMIILDHSPDAFTDFIDIGVWFLYEDMLLQFLFYA